MKGSEHPEELIERALVGQLQPLERSSLARHMEICRACAAHHDRVTLFEAQLEAQSRDNLFDRRAVNAVLAQLAAPVPLSRRLFHWRWVAAVALLMASGSAAVALIAGPFSLRPSAPDTQSASLGKPTPAVHPSVCNRPKHEIDTGHEPLPTESPVQTRTPARPPPPAPAAATVASLFQRGGVLRRQGRTDAAINVYRKLQQLYPRARETRLSFALSGRLLLDVGRPGEALVQFDKSLAFGSAVDEEALAGRATSLERVGRPSEAAAAWRRFLALFPRSIYADHASSRIGSLGAGDATHR